LNEKGKPSKKDLPHSKTISQVIYGLKNLSFIADIQRLGIKKQGHWAST